MGNNGSSHVMLEGEESLFSLPYFPQVKTRGGDNDDVQSWWFERGFAQSQFGKHSKSGTNSCALIVILTANKIAENEVDTKAKGRELPAHVIETYAQAILHANATYYGLEVTESIVNTNFSIPEAMEILSTKLNPSLQEWFFVHVHIPVTKTYKMTASTKIHSTIKDGIQLWNMLHFRKDYIFVIVIADSRSILLCFQNRNKVATLFDSHSHMIFGEQKGAVIAQTEWRYLKSLSTFIVEMFMSVYKVKPKIYEISFLPLK